MRKGCYTIDDLKANSTRDPSTHCWHWNGAKCGNGTPRMYTLDLRTMEKKMVSGPKAAWMIAFGRVPYGTPYRGCLCTDCVNPAHLKEARGGQREIGAYIAARGTRKGRHVVACRESAALGWAAQGIEVTPAEKVFAIRAAPASVTARALAAQLGMKMSTVCRIRRGESHKHLLPLSEAA